MADASTIFGQLITRFGTLFATGSGYARIPNPYDLPKNNGNILKQGWGLSVFAGVENTNRFMCATRSMRIQFQLHLTRRYYALEHDSAKKADCDIALLTDFETFFDDAWKNNLNASGLNVVGGAFGIQSVFAEDAPYRVLTANFTVEYFRQN